MKKIIWTLIIILLLGAGFRYVMFNTDLLDNFLGQNVAEETTLANPASVYCEQQSGTLEIVDETGEQTGMCHLSDGTICEERAYFRGECPVTTTTASSFEPNRFFIVQSSVDPASEFHIFNKKNLREPYKIVHLPEVSGGIYVGTTNSKPIYFSTTEIYIVAYAYDPELMNSIPFPDYRSVVFKISYDGAIKQVNSLEYMSCKIIDNINKKIACRSATTQTKEEENIIKIFDITKKTTDDYTYPTKNGEQVFNLLSFEDNILTLVISHGENSLNFDTAKAVSIDMSTKKIVSTIPYAEYELANSIQYNDNICYGCFSIKGKKYGAYYGATFTSRIDDSTLLGRNTAGKYVFVPLTKLTIK